MPALSFRLPLTLAACGLLALPAAAARAAVETEPGPALADYQQTQWTAANGAPSGIGSMAQTGDGWLWLGTADGLYRFDGVRFERYPLPSRLGLNKDRINLVHAGPNGDLYITYMSEGLSLLHADGRVEELPAPPQARNGIGAIAVDVDGSLWIIGGNIEHFKDGRWTVVEDGGEWRSSLGTSMLLDQQGRLWVANDLGVWQLDRARGRFARMAGGPGQLLLAPGGGLWQASDAGLVRQVAAENGARPAAYTSAESAWTGTFDDDGVLWLLKCPGGACRARPDAASPGGQDVTRLGRLPRLSGEPQGVLQDREGDIWIATENGLDRFRRNRLLQSGLAGSGMKYSMATDGKGRLWAADKFSGALWRLVPGAPPQAQGGAPVTLVANGRQGAVLIGDRRSIRRLGAAGEETIALPPGPDGKPRDYHMLGILDDGKVLWTATMETGLIGWRDGRWLGAAAFNLPKKIYQSGPAGAGQLWLATGDGTLVLYDDGKLTTYDARAIGMAASVFPGGEPIASGTDGSGVLKDGKLVMLRAANPNVLRNVSGLAVTRDGDRWLNGAAGLVHVRRADWLRCLGDPAQPLRYELLGVLDGYPGRAVLETRWPSAASPDGRHLWLAATGGLVWLDTATLRRNRVAPRPAILGVSADQSVHAGNRRVVLPPGSGQFRIDYTAPALRMPEGLRFEYRLDGIDTHWLNAGTRRGTTYTNVGAGDYVFRLRVFNEDGVPGESEAGLRVTVEPTLAQSLWFRIACGLAVAALGAMLYRYRVRYLAARLAERLEVRTAERERIARTLHDSFLQTVYALILRLHAVSLSIPAGERAREQLENVLEQASNAIDEGRDQLQALRAGDTVTLEQALADLVSRAQAARPGIAVDLRVEGERRRLHAPVADEILAIAGEALHNACRHAGASEIDIRLAYGRRALALTVADNGRGIDAQVLRDGRRAGHWGLVGMRERAAGIGGVLDVGNGGDGIGKGSGNGGALVAMRLPARKAYA